MGKIRIIGGVHRSRQLPVLAAAGLRPTSDRVKETLFNWLGQDLTGKKCLDLFAGSGSLGFEACSRNAVQVVMVEQNAKVAQQLHKNIRLLKVETVCRMLCLNALTYLKTAADQFDVIFLDPPYQSDLLALGLDLTVKLLAKNGLIYIEYDKPPPIPESLLITKSGKAGSVNFALLTWKI